MSTSPDGGRIESLLSQGDDYAARNDIKAATSFYQAALKIAQQGGFVDAGTRPKLEAAVRYIRQSADAYANALKATVSDRTGPDAKRLHDAVEIMAGQRQLFMSEPTVFYFPYLANRQFFERDEFDWVSSLEAETPAIKSELEALLAEGAEFLPYVEDEADRPPLEFYGLQGNTSWAALYLWRDGKPVEENAARFPRTMAALEKVPMSYIGAKTPAVLFSRLTPGAHIPPHRGMLNCRLICHLPLIVPESCWLRVGNETRLWEEGKLLIFDDSFEHEAKNDSGDTRIILLFDIWRPELNDAEKAGISDIFDTIDRFTTISEA